MEALLKSWPACVFFSIVVLGVLFHGPLSSLLNKIVNFSFKGFNTELGLNQQQAQAAASGIDNKPMNTIPAAPTAFPTVEASTREDIAKAIQGKSDSDKIEMLTNIAVNAWVNLLLGHTYFLIFGSQIRLLDRLSGAPAGLKSEVVHNEIFKPIVEQNPTIFTKPDAYDEWLRFLKDRKLIVMNDDLIVITSAGKEFLIFLVWQNLNKNRAL